MPERCCCCPEPGPASAEYTIMKLDPSDGSRIWFNDCKFNATSKIADFLVTSDGLHVLHSGFTASTSNPESLRYSSLVIDSTSGVLKHQPVLDGNFSSGEYGGIIEADNYYWLIAGGGSQSVLVDKSDFSATRVAFTTGGGSPLRRNINIAVWGDYVVSGGNFGNQFSYLRVHDTDGSIIKTINLSSTKHMYAFHQSNEDGKIVIWFRDTDDSPDGHYIGIYDLDSEDYDDTLELSESVIDTVETTDVGYDINGDYAAIVGNSTGPNHNVEVFNLNNLSASHWDVDYSTGDANVWSVGPIRVSSDGSEVACPAYFFPNNSVAVFNSSGLKWRKTHTSYGFTNTSQFLLDFDFDSSGNVYTYASNPSSEYVVLKLHEATGVIVWEKDWAHPADIFDPRPSRITVRSDGVYVCGQLTEPYHI